MKDRTITIPNLLFNTNNYRYEPQGSQHDALVKLLEDMGDKIFALAQDIAEHGLNPAEALLVIPAIDNNKLYVVLEGNRRLCALKCTENPSIIPGEFLALKNKFIKLKKKIGSDLIKDVRCVICQDESEAQVWIKRKHEGALNGIGTVTWNAQQKQRFEELVEGKSSDALQIISLLQQSPLIEDSLKDQLQNINISNLARLIDDPYVRTSLGLEKNDGRLIANVVYEELIKGLKKIVVDVLDSTFKVSTIYTKEQRKVYVDALVAEWGFDKTKKADSPWAIDNPSAADKGGAPTPPSSKPARKKRTVRTMIPANCNLPITIPKISSIFNELKSLPVDKFPFSCAILLRVFLELSLDAYIDSFHIVYGNASTACDSPESLRQKFQRVLNELQQNHKCSQSQYQGIRREMKDECSIISVETLNAFVHNKTFSPKVDNLIKGWNNIQVFFEILWDLIANKS